MVPLGYACFLGIERGAGTVLSCGQLLTVSCVAHLCDQWRRWHRVRVTSSWPQQHALHRLWCALSRCDADVVPFSVTFVFGALADDGYMRALRQPN